MHRWGRLTLRSPDRPVRRLLLRLLVLPLLGMFVGFGVVRSVIADWNDVPTGSMQPTILPGDRIFVSKLAYGLRLPMTDTWLARWDHPSRGDVVICFSPKDGTRLVKRVVGIPGDTLEMRDNVLTVNARRSSYWQAPAGTDEGVPMGEQLVSIFAEEVLAGRAHPVMFCPFNRSPRSFSPVRLAPGQYWVMGDNRDNSGDSRSFGVVREDQIQGRVLGVALSMDPQAGPRWDRFGKGLQ